MDRASEAPFSPSLLRSLGASWATNMMRPLSIGGGAPVPEHHMPIEIGHGSDGTERVPQLKRKSFTQDFGEWLQLKKRRVPPAPTDVYFRCASGKGSVKQLWTDGSIRDVNDWTRSIRRSPAPHESWIPTKSAMIAQHCGLLEARFALLPRFQVRADVARLAWSSAARGLL